ncbi:hypothetical protein GOODEAATRI_019330 [Goodea atripinnis]|uniref:Uncharacterized protein n=1 Tax=Goodea atripinnis TaxID=208336 RepID=A0ABV0NVY3_9TELE
MGELVPISNGLRARGRVHPGQVISPLQEQHRTHRTNNHANILLHSFYNLEGPINLTVMFLDCGRKKRENPRMHGESMQKDPRMEVEPRIFLLQGNSATNWTTTTKILYILYCHANY